MIPPTANNIPDELRAHQNWITWKSAPPKKPGGKPRKIPIDPRTGKAADTTDPATWGTLDQALTRMRTDALSGIGFVFTKEAGFAGVDLDNCRDPETGEVEAWALEIIERLASYTEVSPSGTGVHVILRGSLPQGRRKQGDIEMYDEKRFFAFTGQVLGALP